MPSSLNAGGLDAHRFFSARELRRAADYQRFVDVLWALHVVATIVALAVLSRRAPRLVRTFGLGRIGAGVIVAMLILVTLWFVSLPFGFAAQWWDARHGLAPHDYVSWIFAPWATLASEALYVLVFVVIVLGLAGRFGDRWWLIDPEGSPTLSIGVDTVRYEGDRIHGTGAAPYLEAVRRKYADREAWEQATLARLRGWGFNTIGAWSDRELWPRGMPYTVILDIADKAGADWLHGRPVDVFDPRFEKAAQEIAERQCAPRAHDRHCVGYFSDNELRWGPDWRGKETMLDLYLKLPAGAPGKREAINFLRHRYSDDIRRLNFFADIFFQATRAASRRHPRALGARRTPTSFWKWSRTATSRCAPGPSAMPIRPTCTSARASRARSPIRFCGARGLRT